MVQMLDHQLDRGAFAPFQRRRQLAMRIRRAGRCAGRLVDRDDERGSGDQVAQHLEQDVVVRSLREQQMKLARELQNGAPIIAAPGLLLTGDMLLQALDVLAGRRFDDALHDARLDQPPCGEHLAGLAHRGLGYHGAAIAHQRHDPLMGEALQHLAHARPADPEYLAELAFHQAGLGRQAVIDDGAPNAFVYLRRVDAGFGHALALLERVVKPHVGHASVRRAMAYPIEQPAAFGVGHAGEIADRHGSASAPAERSPSTCVRMRLGRIEHQALGGGRKSRLGRRCGVAGHAALGDDVPHGGEFRRGCGRQRRSPKAPRAARARRRRRQAPARRASAGQGEVLPPRRCRLWRSTKYTRINTPAAQIAMSTSQLRRAPKVSA